MTSTSQQTSPLAVTSPLLPVEVVKQLPVGAHKFAARERERMAQEEMTQVVGVVSSTNLKAYYAVKRETPKGELVESDSLIYFQLLGTGLDGPPCVMTVTDWAKLRPRPKVGSAITAVLAPMLSHGGTLQPNYVGYRVVALRLLKVVECPEVLREVIDLVMELSSKKQDRHLAIKLKRERKKLLEILERFPEGLTADKLLGQVREDGQAAVEGRVPRYSEAIELMLKDGQLEERPGKDGGPPVLVLVTSAVEPGKGAEAPESGTAASEPANAAAAAESGPGVSEQQEGADAPEPDAAAEPEKGADAPEPDAVAEPQKGADAPEPDAGAETVAA